MAAPPTLPVLSGHLRVFAEHLLEAGVQCNPDKAPPSLGFGEDRPSDDNFRARDVLCWDGDM